MDVKWHFYSAVALEPLQFLLKSHVKNPNWVVMYTHFLYNRS